MKSYFMVSECDGGLYDTRRNGWHTRPALRADFSKHHRKIETVGHLKATIRAGEFAFPGAYRLFFVTSDGGALSFDSVINNLQEVVHSVRNRCDDGWRVIGCDNSNYYDDPVFCDHSGEQINE